MAGQAELDALRRAVALSETALGATSPNPPVGAVVLVVIVRFSRRLGSLGWAWAFGLLLGGALGNLTDRLVREPGFGRGHVVDFIDYHDLFIGNVADIAIVSAAILIGLLGAKARDRNSIIGVLMPFGLGLGILFLALYPGRSANKFGLLTGQIVSVDDPQLGLLMLRDHPDVERSVPGATFPPVALADAVVESAREAGVRVWEVEALAGHPIERLASLIAMTDYVATYLALGLGLDPAVSRHVTELRDRTS